MKHKLYKSFVFAFALALGLLCSGFIYAQNAMTLEECVNYALENNITVKQQALNTNYMENQYKQSKYDRAPSFNANMGESLIFGRTTDGNNGYINQNSSSFSVGASADVTLFNNMAKLNTVKQRKVNLDAALYDLQKVKDDISLAIASAYLQILFNKELVASSKAQLEVTRLQIESNKKQVEAGTLAKGMLYETEALAANEELTLTNYENQLQISLLDLAQLLEIEFTDNFDIVVPAFDESLLAIALLNIDTVFSKAVDVRPEILSKELALKASEYDYKIAKAQLYPTLSAFYDYSNGYNTAYKDTLGSVIPFGEQFNTNQRQVIGLRLSIPIFNGYRGKTGVKNAKIGIQNSRYDLQLEKNNLRKEIQQVHANAVAAMKKYYASEKAVSSSQEAFRYIEEKFNLGIVTPLEYNDSKSKLTNAQSSFIQAKYEYIFRVKILDFYNGKQITL